jgi:NitT/TauT family transport system ATP-binding protein
VSATRGHGLGVRVEAVSKTFSLGRGVTIEAIEKVDLEIGEGEFVALIGASGSGKSTILRMIAGLESPTTGTLTIGGLEPHSVARDHRLGVAFQEHALLPWLTVRRNLELPFRVAGRPVNRPKIDELIALVGLEGFADARPNQLSGGMRQRVSIARALVLDPAVLLLDEPFGALDAVTRRRLNVELQAIWARLRVTTLLVTHSVEEAVFLADRVVVLTPRPATVVRAFEIGFERPRHPELLRDSRLHALVDEFSLLLDAPEGRPGRAERARVVRPSTPGRARRGH